MKLNSQSLLSFTKISLFLSIFYLMGALFGSAVCELSPASSPSVLLSETQSWGLGFSENGKRPTGTASIEELSRYQAYYAADTEEKVIYLTFDAGYENGNTPAILQALKKHHVPATFFVVGTYIKSQPELIKTMLKDGHIVGNHTMSHPDMSAISEKNAFQKELKDVETFYYELTGKEMAHFYRPPRGIYNTDNLQMAKELGYHTFFWSLAYADWDQNQQPSQEEAFDKLLSRIHPGAIVLLHTTSSTNAAILDTLLTKWTEMGYTFGKLTDLIS